LCTVDVSPHSPEKRADDTYHAGLVGPDQAKRVPGRVGKHAELVTGISIDVPIIA
jgi:hypothetical protein